MILIRKNNKGFTLIEILIVCAMIAMLATIAIVTYDKAKAKSRDATRVQDVETIANAFYLYNQDSETYLIPGTGNTAWNGGVGGAGWFNDNANISASYNAKSIAQGLVDAGFVRNIIKDPSSNSAYTNPGYNYMFAYDDNVKKATVYARLENPTTEQTSTTNTAIYNVWIGNNQAGNPYLRNYVKTISN